MTEPPGDGPRNVPGGDSPDEGLLAGAPLDLDDSHLLDEIRRLYTAADPVPPGLAALSRFAMDPHPGDVHLLRPRNEPALPAAVRATGDLRTVTFETPDLTIVVTIAVLDDTTARLDGWTAPATPHHLTLRTSSTTLTTATDPLGRFLFERTPRGPAQLTVHRPGEETPVAVSPALVL
ncbi:hypothetical protein [Sphaerisporangium aureirubrum]|uniref:Carboxypeptidase regulatory-like domain-containing protein n=1 Tax=Sphaerisporangium aureirubrum TaxID=1544736 RepID=A0ABW1NRA6_9ACTN